MGPRIYTSDLPDAPIIHTSIFTRLFASQGPGDIGGHPESKTAFIDAATGTSITRAELLTLSLSFGYGIRDHPTTAPFATGGATVLIYSLNSLAWPVVLLGCVSAGLRCTLANNAYISRELAHQYRDSCADLLITAEDGIDTVQAMFHELGIARHEVDRRIVVLGRDLRWAGGPTAALDPRCRGMLTLHDLLVRGKLEREEQFNGALAHETVYLCYSSGTTGKPKGVETTHQNMTTIMDVMITSNMFLEVQSGNSIVLGVLPFYHLYGAALLLQLSFTLGWSVVIQPQFDPVQFCAAIERFKVSFAFIVPPVLVVLARHSAVDQHDLSSLQYMLSAAAPLGADLVKQVKARLLAKRPSGATCLISQGYGLTETTTGTHILPFADADLKVGSVGKLLPNMEARIIHDEEGAVEAELGKPGELWVRGKTVMKGYLNNHEATANAITPDGWFKTGDIVVQDKEGYLYIVDRCKELIKYKGFQVPPAELESVLLTHPDIADAAVIGVENHEQATELPRAYVVHTRPQEIKTVAEMTAFAKGVVQWTESRVAKHKYLRGGVRVIDAVPKSAAGKILRRELRELAKQEMARGEIDTGFKSKL
ncbi:AMP binding protein [Mycena leptocephala]|nr:AMP binding protein [Mycena leptocephala]